MSERLSAEERENCQSHGFDDTGQAPQPQEANRCHSSSSAQDFEEGGLDDFIFDPVLGNDLLDPRSSSNADACTILVESPHHSNESPHHSNESPPHSNESPQILRWSDLGEVPWGHRDDEIVNSGRTEVEIEKSTRRTRSIADLKEKKCLAVGASQQESKSFIRKQRIALKTIKKGTSGMPVTFIDR